MHFGDKKLVLKTEIKVIFGGGFLFFLKNTVFWNSLLSVARRALGFYSVIYQERDGFHFFKSYVFHPIFMFIQTLKYAWNVFTSPVPSWEKSTAD